MSLRCCSEAGHWLFIPQSWLGSNVVAGLTQGLQEPRMLAEWEVGGCLRIPGFKGIFCSDLALHLDSPGSVLPSALG